MRPHDTCSRPPPAGCADRPDRRPAARAPGSSDAARTAAATPCSGHRPRTRPRRRSGAAATAGRCSNGVALPPGRARTPASARRKNRRSARCPGRDFLPEHVPGLDRPTQLDLDAPMLDGAVARKAELQKASNQPGPMRTRARKSSTTSSRSCRTKCGSMKRSCSAVPQRTSGRAIGLAPEPRYQGAQQQHLHQAHARVRRHLEGAQLHQPQTPVGPSGEYSLSMQNSAR